MPSDMASFITSSVRVSRGHRGVRCTRRSDAAEDTSDCLVRSRSSVGLMPHRATPCDPRPRTGSQSASWAVQTKTLPAPRLLERPAIVVARGPSTACGTLPSEQVLRRDHAREMCPLSRGASASAIGAIARRMGGIGASGRDRASAIASHSPRTARTPRAIECLTGDPDSRPRSRGDTACRSCRLVALRPQRTGERPAPCDPRRRRRRPRPRPGDLRRPRRCVSSLQPRR